jgi:hypothetical protein
LGLVSATKVMKVASFAPGKNPTGQLIQKKYSHPRTYMEENHEQFSTAKTGIKTGHS